jgi:hypothetical protein
MKKILFITTRNPYSGRFSGDVIGSLKIISLLKKKNKVDIVTLGQESIKKKNIIFFRQPNYLLKILYAFLSLLKKKPLQFGFFYSASMKKYIEKNAINYDLLFFYHIRSSQYLPKNYNGNTIIEMADLYSQNYYQTFCNLNILNPLKYIYLLESLLVKNTENKIFLNFNKIILFAKSEIKKISRSFRKKIFHINLSINSIQNEFLFSTKNNRILFIGNLTYIPNLLAVKDFIINILPNLRKEIPNIEFYAIGNIKKTDKFLLSFYKNVYFLGQQTNIKKYIKKSFCGLANLKIATGVQGKVLTYMSYGLPVVCSKKVSSNFKNYVMDYSTDKDLIKKIIILNSNKKISYKFSKKSLEFAKRHSDSKINFEYLKILNFNKKLS